MIHETASNTGAQTPPPGGMLGFVDWLSCSFLCEADVGRGGVKSKLAELMTLLGVNWIPADTGQNGYSRGMRCGGISLWYDGLSNMGIGLVITGDGCRELELSAIKRGWPAFLSELLKRKARVSRIDVAIDDHAGLLSLKKIGHCCDNGLKVTRLKLNSRTSRTDGPSGREVITGYKFGSRESDTMLRIYDKACEQGSSDHHIRVELQVRRKRSAELAKRLATGDSGIIAGMIAATIDFKVKGVSSHRYRWKSQKWWEDFVGHAKKVRLSTAPSNQSLKKSMDFLEHQYGMTMALVVRTYGQPKLLEMAQNGEVRLKLKEDKLRTNYEYKKAS